MAEDSEDETPDEAPVGPNFGHGWVWRRADGMRARCGGPALCRVCCQDYRRTVTQTETAPG